MATIRQTIRHVRVEDLRKKIEKGCSMESLMNYCLVYLKVTHKTATSYIDEAAAPYRKKFQEET